MLVEKAYAKLHGSYEAIANGRVGKVLHDLTPAANVNVLRLERFRANRVCDEVWNTIEKALNDNRLVGCMRSVRDPYADNMLNRQGVTLGMLCYAMLCYIAE
jgi:hypothetical protein